MKTPQCGSAEGVASYYAGNFIGRKTANGEIFTSMELTAAHKTLPFGTKLKVTNRRNGKVVHVRVNDRGPYIRGRMLDLSLAAARDLAFEHQGLTDIVIESCR
jgi:rare lipoprotein A